uniref:F-box domain-containing protein n=1 Tax=Aegilops tauschii subsp. strangulata TaxID=200361 RepID=A0A452Y124_AEGTS
MGTRCWSSLMPELIDRIGGCLLDTADLDCYMALRAVCHNWRGATADPKNTLHTRFRPHHWVMLDYSSHGEHIRLLVNTVSGRYHGRDMPLLCKYYIISITIDGLLVLMAKIPPHAVCVLNPFTGHMVHFVARMRPNVLAAAVSDSSPPRLVLYCHDTRKLYMGGPNSVSFISWILRKVVSSWNLLEKFWSSSSLGIMWRSSRWMAWVETCWCA